MTGPDRIEAALAGWETRRRRAARRVVPAELWHLLRAPRAYQPARRPEALTWVCATCGVDPVMVAMVDRPNRLLAAMRKERS